MTQLHYYFHDLHVRSSLGWSDLWRLIGRTFRSGGRSLRRTYPRDWPKRSEFTAWFLREEQVAPYKYSLQNEPRQPRDGRCPMILVRRMLQQVLRVSGRSAFPLLKWMERWAEGASVVPEAAKLKAARTLDDMPGPSFASFFWDLFAKRGLSRLHELQVGGDSKWWKQRNGPLLFLLISHEQKWLAWPYKVSVYILQYNNISWTWGFHSQGETLKLFSAVQVQSNCDVTKVWAQL